MHRGALQYIGMPVGSRLCWSMGGVFTTQRPVFLVTNKMIKQFPSSSEALHRVISRIGDVTVLVVGDFILDRFVNGVIERISPEAPIPVLHGRGETLAMGGAGNVVSNIISLGARAVPVSVIGEDAAAGHLVRMLGEIGVDTRGLAQQPGGASAVLRRLVDEARKAEAGPASPRAAMDAAYHFTTVMAGDRPGYEEAIRALYAKDAALFTALSRNWPSGIRDHALALAAPAFA